MAIGGEHSDVLTFGDYVQKNLAFMEYKNGHKLSIEDTANFVRNELAEAIRKGPYMVNCLLAGFEGDQPRLYWLDYLGSVVEVRKAAHGYAEFLTSSVMDTLEHSVNTFFYSGCEPGRRHQDHQPMPKLSAKPLRDEPSFFHNQSHHQRRNQGDQVIREAPRILSYWQ